jgi:hypothetical protein
MDPNGHRQAEEGGGSSAGRGCAVKLGGKSWHRDGVEGNAKAGEAILGLDDGWAR